MAGIALRNSFLLTSPSPLASHSRKRSSTLPAFWRSAAAICSWIGGASGPSSRSILPSVVLALFLPFCAASFARSSRPRLVACNLVAALFSSATSALLAATAARASRPRLMACSRVAAAFSSAAVAASMAAATAADAASSSAANNASSAASAASASSSLSSSSSSSAATAPETGAARSAAACLRACCPRFMA